eukprot:CAMPEP_0177688976 /NCGR_PEP_ID=MMETSP0447-20121125/34930_1 /TAXON_ID=0 /ORGANISM="Stygamoeba regulata, Strain BSH-02190019" /LENGTH=77 /DNA_ID=CAMNT_0019199283 /DNA_START=235 /DNA_END=464 /DNA_ORIENTATION=-
MESVVVAILVVGSASVAIVVVVSAEWGAATVSAYRIGSALQVRQLQRERMLKHPRNRTRDVVQIEVHTIAWATAGRR